MTSEPIRPIASVGRRDVTVVPDRPVRVTVVIPNYNYARFLRQSVGSALDQRDVDVDVVVVDDASTDDSVEVIEHLRAADPRVRAVLSPQNRGAVETFNAGLELAEGEYIVRLDADDILTPGSLARAVALGERFPNVGLIYGRPVHFHGEPSLPSPGLPSGWTVWGGDEWLELRCRLGVNCITSPEAVMRASVIRAAGGGQRRELPHAHDMEMWFRLARFGDVGHVDGVVQALHREHATSLSALGVDVIGDMHHREKVFELLFEDGSPRSAQLLELARQAIAEEALTRFAGAYAAGRGDSPETAAYLEVAREQGVALRELPSARAAGRARRLGSRRARFSPYLLARAAAIRVQMRRRFVRTLQNGI